MLKEGRYVFTYPSLFLNLCYKTYFFSWIICRFIQKSVFLQCVFHSIRFKVNKGWIQRYSFFYVRTSALGEKNHLVYVIVSCL